MKKLLTVSGSFGPYYTVETISDRYRCDGADLPFSIVGEGVIEEWVGELPSSQPSPKVVPKLVTMRQARLALLEHDLLSSVATVIANLPSPEKERAQIEWEFSSNVIRDREFVVSLGTALGLSPEQLDDLFIHAETL